MRQRDIKKRNKKTHCKLLSYLKPFTVTDVRFYSHYFIFNAGSAAICHFRIKELPHWLFGIWITKHKPVIFGQIEILIDKFKPSYSELNSDDPLKFREHLQILKTKGGFFSEEDKEAFWEEKKTLNKLKVANLQYYQEITKFIVNFNMAHDSMDLRLKDLGENTFPRYWVTVYADSRVPENKMQEIWQQVEDLNTTFREKHNLGWRLQMAEVI